MELAARDLIIVIDLAADKFDLQDMALGVTPRPIRNPPERPPG